MPQTNCKPQNKPAINLPNRLVFDYFMAKTEKIIKLDKKNDNRIRKPIKPIR